MNFKTTMIIGAMIALPMSAFAAGENNVGCGLGAQVFGGQSGVGPQVMAATTNGTSGNQTFGISFGTLGCTTNGTVPTAKKLGLFIDGNMERLARDMSRGSGESLTAMTTLMGMTAAEQTHFNVIAKSHFTQIYKTDASSTSADVVVALRSVLAADASLAAYASVI
jgi:hypothetical protein